MGKYIHLAIYLTKQTIPDLLGPRTEAVAEPADGLDVLAQRALVGLAAVAAPHAVLTGGQARVAGGLLRRKLWKQFSFFTFLLLLR